VGTVVCCILIPAFPPSLPPSLSSQGSVCPSEVLRNINVVDTPGVLAGNKQTVARG